MAEKTITAYQGLLVPRWTFDTVAAKGAGATDSSYNQKGPRPGVPDPSNDDGLVLASSGSQSADGQIEVKVQRAGVTGADEAGFLWRDVAGGDSTSQWKGWDPYQVVTGWRSLVATTLSTLWQAWYIQGIQTQAGKALVLATQSITSPKRVRIDEFDPDTNTWTQLNGPTLDYDASGGCLLQLPSGRILLYLEAQSQRQIDVYRSDDDGGTWEVHSRACLRTDLTNDNDKSIIRAAYSGGQVALLIVDPSTADKVFQYASDDDGARFSLVDAQWDVGSSTPSGLDMIGLPDGGGFFLTFLDDTGSNPYNYVGRKIGSAWEEFASAPEIALSPSFGGAASAPTEACSSLWLDEDGYLYVAVTHNPGSRYVAIRRSIDEGATWLDVGHTPLVHASDLTFRRFAAVPVAGRLAFVTRWTSAGTSYDPYSYACVWLGGYGSHTVPAAIDVSTFTADWGAFTDGAQIAYMSGDGSNDGGQWIAADNPSSAWTSGGAGSFALGVDADGRLVGTFTDAAEYSTTHSNAATAVFCEFIARAIAGTAKLEVRLAEDPSSGSTPVYSIAISLTSTGELSIFDSNSSAVVGTAATGLTGEAYRVRVALDNSGNVRTWYAPQRHVAEWTEGPHATGLANSPGTTTNRVAFGSFGTGSDVDYLFCGFCYWPYRWSAEQLDTKIGEAWTNPDSLHPRSVPGRPTVITDGVKVQGVGGIGQIGDDFDITARYDAGLELAFPEVEPSPARVWESEDTTEQIIVFDRESVSWALNQHTSYQEAPQFGVWVLGANFPQFVVEAYNGSAWVSLGTADGTISGLEFDRHGRHLHPKSAATTVDQYLFHGVHAGDTVDLGAGEDDERYRRIERNTGGVWTSGTARKPVLTLQGVGGSEVGTGTAKIWVRDFGIVIHDRTDTYELYRVRIPAQTTVDGTFRCKIVAGPVFPFGWVHDSGWSVAKERPYRDVRVRSGRRRRKTLGPMRRVLDVGWTLTAIDSTAVYGDQSAALPDYIVPGVTEAGATVQDQVSLVEGLVEDAAGGPVIFLRSVPSGSASVSIKRREAFIYGRIVSQAQRDNVVGDELSSELDRLNTLRIEEEV